MRKTKLISILAILLMAMFVLSINNQQIITAEQSVSFLAIKPTLSNPKPSSIEPILFKAYPEIVQAYTVWDTPDSLMLHTVPLKNYYHENGSYFFSPPGNYVCEQMGLKCDTLEYKSDDGPWTRIERTVSGLHPCEFQNIDIYRDSTMVVLVPPYSPFFWGAGKYWTSFPINSTRGVVDYNVTIVNATSSQVEINVTTRWIPDNKPQSLNISIGTKKVFDQKANMIIYVRGIDLPNKTVHVTIVRESSTKYRAVCKMPTLQLSTR